MIRQSALAALCLLGCPAALSAQGFQNEIEVFTQDTQRPGEWGVDLHLNSILRGPETTPPEELPFVHAFNSVAEFSLGLSPTLEAGLYLPVSWSAQGHDLFAGPELRLKWIPLRPEGGEDAHGAFLGANFSVARQNQAFSTTHTQVAVTGILGHQGSRWLFAVNPSLTWALSGDAARGTPEAGSSWKLAWLETEGIHPGVEYYADHGPLNHLSKAGEQQQNLYGTLDVDHRPWVFNVGLGRGLTPSSDRWTLKFVFEIPLQ